LPLRRDKLNLELAYLRRMRYGRSSEQMDAQQLELLAQNSQANAAPVIDLQAERERAPRSSGLLYRRRHSTFGVRYFHGGRDLYPA
jgi:hypothetical protein